MRKTLIILSVAIISVNACKISVPNQKNNKKKEGFWIEKYTDDSSDYKSLGKYKNDDPIKKWKHYKDSKLIKVEKYKGNSCNTRIYFENGKLQSKGKTCLDNSTKYAHWYYSGNWDYYNEEGKLIMKRLYNKGKLVSETKLNK